MEEAVKAMEGGLSAAVSEYGENLSQGQRQLLCLGRALLLQCRVLLLDEATSACDLETDAAVQHTLRTAFARSTVITIAHRIKTIVDSDLIIVLGNGEVLEADSPTALLADPSSQFSSIASELQGGGDAAAV